MAPSGNAYETNHEETTWFRVPILRSTRHCAAATENFLALEHHSVDVSWWEDLVEGEKPLFSKGFANLPTRPGVGVTLNDDVAKQHLAEPGYFEPTPQWNQERVNDRLWS